jgi:hypothetical protein
MAYYTDGNGNYYCGRFSQQINYTYNTSDLNINNTAGTLRTDLTAIFGLLSYRFSSFTGTWTNGSIPNGRVTWKTANDPILTSVMRSQLLVADITLASSHVDDNGSTAICSISENVRNNQSYTINQNGITLINHTTTSLTVPDYTVICLTELIDVNTTIPTNSVTPYYSSFYKNRLLLFNKANISSTIGQHRVEQTNTSNKPILLTADAVYGITCNDGQTAGTDLWVTKLHVFDNTLRSNGVSSKYSRIGTVPNMAIGIGTSWIVGRIYQFNTNLFPGNNNKWLCVGNWNNLNNRFVLVNVWSV